jgi:lipoprotein-anchoring transpeptidase ErfK/SrfK
MTEFMLSRLGMVAVVAALIAAQAVAQTAAPSTPKRLIVVSLEDRKLALLEDGQVKKIYPVAVGARISPSPVGTFTIERRVSNPTYSHDGVTVPPGPGNPVGTRWMGLSVRGYGIHGTNQPRSIGKAASHGCIRMARPDLEELYAQMHVGDTVVLIGQRNEQTARLFGAPVTATPATMLVAQSQPAPVAITNAGNTATNIAANAVAGMIAGGR